jgi:hypothetical protein
MAQIVPDQYLQLTREQLIALSYIYNQYELFQMILTDPQYAQAMRQIGFVPSAGTWNDVKTFIASAEESVKTTLPAVGTATTALVNTVRPVTGVTAAQGATKVTTSGILTATSTSVGAVACAGALGFVTGVNAFEAAPEAWTKLSNLVFGTDLDPSEIGELARNTNALVMIKDGVCYMAEDLITAIRDALFDIGAAESGVSYPTIDSAATKINVVTSLSLQDFLPEIDTFLGTTTCASRALQSKYDELRKLADEGYADIMFSTINNKPYVLINYYYDSTTFVLPLNDLSIRDNQAPNYCITNNQYTFHKRYYANLHINDDGLLDGNIEQYGVSATRLQIGDHTTGERGNIYDGETHNLTGLNATAKPGIDGITPTGEQGTKDQTLDEVFPDWAAKAVTTLAGLEALRRWFPVSIPSTDPSTEAYPYTTPVAQEGLLPQLDTDPMLQLQTNPVPDATAAEDFPAQPTPLPQPTPPTTETPSAPAISGGGGSSTGLANLYNPTLAQVKQFSRWLWGSDGLNLDQLKKLLQDPMQAIIGLHVMYATPTTGANRDIQVGYINSGVPSKIVTEQYTEIDCGTVTINEYFGDARDYSPFTQVYCYLPFIGIVELNADDVVNSTLGIKYKIDVLTGCCLAQLTVKKYGLDAVLYTYTGNCAVQMPITSGNYLSMVSSLLGAVVSGAAAVATGGALAPVAIGAAANAMGGGARASVAMSGSLGSNAGAMGIRKPYLIIKRVESADANGYNEFYGYPTNKRVNLSQLTGYVRVKEINLSGTNATEDEQNEIVTLLKEGVIL